MENSHCPVCESSAKKVLYFRERDLPTGKLSFRILRCFNCSHLFVNPVPVFGEEDNFEGHKEDMSLKDWERVNKKIKKWNTSWRRFVLDEYLGYKKEPSTNILKYLWGCFLYKFTSSDPLPFCGEGKILDVGCNNGLYPFLLKNLGWQVWGVEVDRNACELAKKLDIDAFCGNLEEANFSSLSFDVVRFNQVLEHIPNPRETLKEAKRILKKGGKLYISVPNTRSLVSLLFREKWLDLWHIQGFSPRSVKYLCRDLGLKIRSMRFSSSRDTLRQAVSYFLKINGNSRLFDGKFIRYVFVSPLSTFLTKAHFSDTLTVEAQK